MFAFDIDANIEWMRGAFSPRYALDENSEEELKKLYKITDVIRAHGGDDRKAFWVRVPSGTYKDYRDSYPEDDEYSEEYFKKEYPDPEKWYFIQTMKYEDKQSGEAVCSVFVGNSYVLSTGRADMKNAWPVDASDFIKALEKYAEVSIEMMRNGTYNETIERDLPCGNRYGRISRKEYWDIYPEERQEYRDGFRPEDFEEFAAERFADDEQHQEPENCLKRITARDYFEACMIGYKAAGIEMRRIPGESSICERDTEEERQRYGGYTAREWYRAIAEGRDDGLTGVPLDDPDAMAEWMSGKGPYHKFNGGHPWEVVSSFSISHSLHFQAAQEWPRTGNGGYYFIVSGDTFGRSAQAIAFYLAVKRAGYPVMLSNAKAMQARLLETDDIGIEPYSSFMGGPNGRIGYDVLDITDLSSEEKADEIIKKTRWLPEEKTELKA